MTVNESYDADLQQYRSTGTVKPHGLLFLRWAVAQGRLPGDGHSYHAATVTEVAHCEGVPKCGICALCTGEVP